MHTPHCCQTFKSSAGVPVQSLFKKKKDVSTKPSSSEACPSFEQESSASNKDSP